MALFAKTKQWTTSAFTIIKPITQHHHRGRVTVLFSSLLFSSVKKKCCLSYTYSSSAMGENLSVPTHSIYPFFIRFSKHLKNQRNKTHVEHLSNQQVQTSNVVFYFLFLNYSWIKDVTNHTVVR